MTTKTTEYLIECIHVPVRPDLDPAKVVTIYVVNGGDDPYDDQAVFEVLEDLRCSLAQEIGVEREFLPDEGTFFRISERS